MRVRKKKRVARVLPEALRRVEDSRHWWQGRREGLEAAAVRRCSSAIRAARSPVYDLVLAEVRRGAPGSLVALRARVSGGVHGRHHCRSERGRRSQLGIASPPTFTLIRSPRDLIFFFADEFQR